LNIQYCLPSCNQTHQKQEQINQFSAESISRQTNQEMSRNKTLISFWSKLKVGYDSFQTEAKELNFKIDEKGNYTF
jgi:murein L,D-transpeptidase YafK